MEEKRQPVIQVKNLYKIFRVGDEKVRALNGVDLTIYKGEFCAIVGTSGSPIFSWDSMENAWSTFFWKFLAR